MNQETSNVKSGAAVACSALLDDEKARLTTIIDWLKAELTQLHRERRLGPRHPTAHRTPEQEARVKQAVKMRLDGCTYKEIGDALGVTPWRASQICFQGYLKIGHPW